MPYCEYMVDKLGITKSKAKEYETDSRIVKRPFPDDARLFVYEASLEPHIPIDQALDVALKAIELSLGLEPAYERVDVFSHTRELQYVMPAQSGHAVRINVVANNVVANGFSELLSIKNYGPLPSEPALTPRAKACYNEISKFVTVISNALDIVDEYRAALLRLEWNGISADDWMRY